MRKGWFGKYMLHCKPSCFSAMKTFGGVGLVVYWMLLATISQAGEDKQTPGVVPSLVRGEIARDGGRFPVVGVSFKVDSPWHVYWWYAGKLGRPTTLRAQLSSGLAVRSLWWEVPHKFQAQGVGETYGYDADTVIGVEFAGIPQGGIGSDDTVSITLSWAACNPEVCVPGRRTLSSKYGSLKEVSFSTVRPLRRSGATPELKIRADFTAHSGGNPTEDWRLVGRLSGVPNGAKVLDWFPSGGDVDPRSTKIETKGGQIELLAEGRGSLGNSDNGNGQSTLPLVVVLATPLPDGQESISMVASEGSITAAGGAGGGNAGE